MKLYLDDIRPCPEGWTLARSVDEAQEAVMDCLERNEEWTDASLDHDLSPEHYASTGPSDSLTGLVFVGWMVMTNLWPTNPPIVHSMNRVGAAAMRRMIERYGPYKYGE